MSDHVDVKAKKDFEKKLSSAINLIEQGNLIEAEQLCIAVLQKDAKNYEALTKMSLIAGKSADYQTSLAYANEAFKHDSSKVEALNLMGMAFLRLGDKPKAMTCFKKAVDLNPKDSTAYQNILLATNKYEDCSDAVRYANICYPNVKNDYTGLNNIGGILFNLGEIEAAEPFIAEALKKNPSNPKLLKNLANVNQTKGKFEEAEIFLREGIRLSENQILNKAEIYSTLTTVKKFSSKDDEDILQMEKLLKSSRLSEKAKYRVQFSLGKAYNDCKEYESSFKNYKSANKLKDKNEGLKGCIYSVYIQNNPEKFIFDKQFFKDRKGWGCKDKTNLLVIGTPRSGTTLTEQILTSHSKIDGVGEYGYMGDMAKDLVSKFCDPSMGFVKNFPREFFDKCGDAYSKYIKTKVNNSGSEFIVNKMPTNFEILGFIKACLPNLKVIHTKRHPLDACLSMYFQNFANGHEYSYNIKNLINFYKSYVYLIDVYKEIFPKLIHDVYYEEMIFDREKVVRGMIKYCGLKWEDECLTREKKKGLVKTASSWQVRQPIYTSSRFRFKNFEPFIDDLKEGLKDEVSAYEKELKSRGIM